MTMLEHETADAVHRSSGSRDEHQTVIKFVISGPIVGADDVAAAPVAAPSTEVAELGSRIAALERALADADARIDALSRALAATVAGVAAAPGNGTSRRTERAAKAPGADLPAPAPSLPPASEPRAVEPTPAPVAPEPVAYEPVAREAAPEPVARETAPEPVLQPIAMAPSADQRIAIEPAALHPIAIEPAAPHPTAIEHAALHPIAIERSAEPFASHVLAPHPTTEPIAQHAVAPLTDPTLWSHPPAALAHDTRAVASSVPPGAIALTLVESGGQGPALHPSHPTPPKVRGLRRMISVLKHL